MKKKELSKKESKIIYPVFGIFNPDSKIVKAIGKEIVFLKEIMFFLSSLTVPKTIECNGYTGYWINQKYLAEHFNMSVCQFRSVLEKLKLNKILVYERKHRKDRRGSESYLVFNKTLLDEIIAWDLLKNEPLKKLKKIYSLSKPFPEKTEKDFQMLKDKAEGRKKRAYERYKMKQKEKPIEEPEEPIEKTKKPVKEQEVSKERKIVIAEIPKEPASWEIPWTPTESEIRKKEEEEWQKKKYSDRISEENESIILMEQRKRRRKYKSGKKL